jgi:hypothetical protein
VTYRERQRLADIDAAIDAIHSTCDEVTCPTALY